MIICVGNNWNLFLLLILGQIISRLYIVFNQELEKYHLLADTRADYGLSSKITVLSLFMRSCFCSFLVIPIQNVYFMIINAVFRYRWNQRYQKEYPEKFLKKSESRYELPLAVEMCI